MPIRGVLSRLCCPENELMPDDAASNSSSESLYTGSSAMAVRDKQSREYQEMRHPRACMATKAGMDTPFIKEHAQHGMLCNNNYNTA